MNFVVHGATLSLAWFLWANAATSLVVALMARGDWRAESPAFWLAARLLPWAGAALFVVVVFLPAYILFEPRNTGEGFDVTLTVCATAAIVFAAAAATRGAAAWLRVHRQTRQWTDLAESMTIAGHRVLVVDVDAPVIALVGVWRSQLLVTRGLVAALTSEELDASIAHEIGHARARDNLKRLAMCALPDVLPPAAARRLEQRWAAAAEHTADRHAGSAGMRCALASALVKVARLRPAEPPTLDPISTLIGGGEIATRVQRLLDDRTPPQPRRRWPVFAAWAALAAAAAFTYLPLLHAVHGATEVLVNALP